MKTLLVLMFFFTSLIFANERLIKGNNVKSGISTVGKFSISTDIALKNSLDFASMGVTRSRLGVMKGEISANGLQGASVSLWSAGMLSVVSGNVEFATFEYDRQNTLDGNEYLAKIKVVDVKGLLPLGGLGDSVFLIGGRFAGGPGNFEISDRFNVATNFLMSGNFEVYAGDFLGETGPSFILMGDITKEYLFLHDVIGEESRFGATAEIAVYSENQSNRILSAGVELDYHYVTNNDNYKYANGGRNEFSLKGVFRF